MQPLSRHAGTEERQRRGGIWHVGRQSRPYGASRTSVDIAHTEPSPTINRSDSTAPPAVCTPPLLGPSLDAPYDNSIDM